MVLTDLESRRKKVLEIVINTYVETAMPVGSVAVSRRSRLGLSPATIRNIMAHLEDSGYLFQPHTSAGRIPTDKGYRYYIEKVMPKANLTYKERQHIEQRFEEQPENIDEFAEFTSHLISEMTGQVGLVLFPRLNQSLLKQLRLFSVSGDRIIVVFMAQSNIIKEKVVKAWESMDDIWLNKICQFINSEYEGTSLGSITEMLKSKILLETDSIYSLCRDALSIFEASGLIEEDDKIFFEGTSHLLQKPEFRDICRSGTLLEFLEKKQGLSKLLRRHLDPEVLEIKIGKENSFKELQDCTSVTSGYKVNDRICGVLGTIGPTRMEYPSTISIVDYIAKRIGSFYEK